MKIIDWVVSLICLGIGITLVAAGHLADGLTLIVISLLVDVIVWWLRAADKQKGEEVATDLRPRRTTPELPPPPPAGRWTRWGEYEEPVPIPGENVAPSHKLGEDPNCGICSAMMRRD